VGRKLAHHTWQRHTCTFGQRMIVTLLWRITLLSLSAFSSPVSPAQTEDPRVTTLKKGESVYFTAKLQHLSDKLSLTPDQQSKLTPIAEQETAYLEEIRANPVLSMKDKLESSGQS
jgi:hypothetical protein